MAAYDLNLITGRQTFLRLFDCLCIDTFVDDFSHVQRQEELYTNHMAQGAPYLSYLKVRTTLPRFSLCTRLLLFVTIVIWIAGYFVNWLRDQGILIPSQVGWRSSR